MFESESEEYTKKNWSKNVTELKSDKTYQYVKGTPHFYSTALTQAHQKGAELGYSRANEWHKVADKLPEMGILVYLWNTIDDFPVVARRQIPYGRKEWVWDCKWGSGYTISQSKGRDYLWKEIVLPELKENE